MRIGRLIAGNWPISWVWAFRSLNSFDGIPVLNNRVLGSLAFAQRLVNQMPLIRFGSVFERALLLCRVWRQDSGRSCIRLFSLTDIGCANQASSLGISQWVSIGLGPGVFKPWIVTSQEVHLQEALGFQWKDSVKDNGRRSICATSRKCSKESFKTRELSSSFLSRVVASCVVRRLW